MRKSLLSLLFLFVVVNLGYATTYYMPDDYANLQAAFPNMSSGDTLIIRDGTYSGSTNVIDHSHKPPNGTSGNFTIVKAENDGEVTFEGVNCDISNASYLKFQGIIWRRISNSGRIKVSSATKPHDIWFLRCGFWSNEDITVAAREDAFQVNWAYNILVEECFAWGNYRYGFYVGSSAREIVVRRCVARLDAYNTQTGLAAYMLYDCKNTEVQNCIAIDIDNASSYYQGPENIPNFVYFRKTSGGYDVNNVNVTGCIALNLTSGQFVLGSTAASITFSNVVFWDSYNGMRSLYGGASYDHCLSGKISHASGSSSMGYSTEQSSEPIENSIALSVTATGIASGGAYSLCDYNCLYDNGNNYSNATTGANSFCSENANAIDPFDGTPGNGTAALLYLVQIESGSDLDGAADDSGDIGPTIIKKFGTTGTFYGDAGYNTLTGEDLWPFPNEAMIRTKMKAYTFDGGAITGDRGFCADGETLTDYIWEYLGNSPSPGVSAGFSPLIIRSLMR